MTGLHDMPIGRLLALAGRVVAIRFERSLEAEGLSLAGWNVLFRLAEQDGLTLTEIATGGYVSQATVTGVVDTLERDGFVARERGEDDRRVVRLRLTKTGRARLARAKAAVGREMGPLFADLSPRDEAVVRRFLTKTVEAAK